MLRELIHFARHAPGAFALQRRVDHVELFEEMLRRADDAGMRERRRALVADVRGDVLEIGCGTGLMFEHYDPGARVRAIEIDETFLDRARERAEGRAIDVELADAQALPFPDESFDAVVACLVFCSIPDVSRALREARRVLRGPPRAGELRLIEHVVSERPVARALMHAVDPVWLHLNGQGCHMDRDTVAAVRSVFGAVDVVDRFQVYSPGFPAFPMVTLHARRE
jgi:ubiquinone/menaquinone biosynthesis C-methylase UbiE